MNQSVVRIVLATVLAGAGLARAADQFTVVEVSDVQRKIIREIKTPAELATLKKAIDAEANVFPKALEQARKDWEDAEKGSAAAKPHALTPFPGGLVARKCTEKGTFADKAKAQKYIDQLNASDAANLAAEAKKKTAVKLTDAEKAKQTHETEHLAAVAKAASAVQSRIAELLKGTAAAEGAAVAEK